MENEFEILWLNNGFKQNLKLVNCRQNVNKKDNFFTMNSPIYKAIADGSFKIDLGYGIHPFIVLNR